jgi:hypothetical protein
VAIGLLIFKSIKSGCGMNNWIRGASIATTAALTFIVGILTFADLYSGSLACASSLGTSQWPKFLGCAMAHNEGLAGGLIAAAAALIAGWVAYWSVQLQLHDAAARRVQAQAEAKEAAIASLTQPIHAAATAMSQLRKILRAGTANTELAGQTLRTAITYVEQSLEGSLIRSVIPELAINERLLATVIVETLLTFVIVTKAPGPDLSPTTKYQRHIDVLMRIRQALRALDSQLADVFDRDGGVPDQGSAT